MKKFLVTLLIFLFFQTAAFSKERGFNVNSDDFTQFGRYVQTLEFNDADKSEEVEKKNEFDDVEFELKAIENVRERFEANAVELKLDEIDEDAVSEVNEPCLFRIKVNENQYKIENAVKNENMILDSSKNFKISAFQAGNYFAPVPSVVNSSVIKSVSDSGLSAAFGQVSLHDSLGTSVLFMRANESVYNTGAVMSYKGGKFNASAGTFSSSYNHASSGGLILSTADKSMLFGSVSFGGAFGKKEENDYDKTSSGLFGEYKYKRLKLNAQIASIGFSDTGNRETGFYFVPEFKLTDSLSLKTRFIRNITQNTMQDELVLSYSPRIIGNNLSLELNASKYVGERTKERQRIKFSASFKI